MRARNLLVAAMAAASLGACATTQPSPRSVHMPTPGYICAMSLGDGKSTTMRLRQDGTVFSRRWEWEWRSDWETGLKLWVIDAARPGRNPNSFPTAVITRTIREQKPSRRSRFRMALTNRAGEDPLNFIYAIAKSDTHKGRSSVSLWMAWSDLMAHATASQDLYLIVYDLRKRTYNSQPFPREMILQANADISTMRARMAQARKDFRNECEASEDIDPPQEILV